MTEPSQTARIRIPAVTLSDGTAVPQLGLGVRQVSDGDAERVVALALDAGYRLIDTAPLYGNEAGVGRAVKAAADRGITRDQIYVTTKLGNPDHGYDSTFRAFDSSAAKLGLDVVDLYLIHWPQPGLDRYLETFKAMLKLQADGRITSVGVCNFTPEHLARVIAETGVAPVLNQIELHPYLQQKGSRAFHAEHSIATEAWSPLGARHRVIDDPVLTEVAGRHGVSSAQAVLAWHLAIGTVVIPKTVTPSRITENLVAATVTLPAEDLALINGLDRGQRGGPDPATFHRA